MKFNFKIIIVTSTTIIKFIVKAVIITTTIAKVTIIIDSELFI